MIRLCNVVEVYFAIIRKYLILFFFSRSAFDLAHGLLHKYA